MPGTGMGPGLTLGLGTRAPLPLTWGWCVLPRRGLRLRLDPPTVRLCRAGAGRLREGTGGGGADITLVLRRPGATRPAVRRGPEWAPRRHVTAADQGPGVGRALGVSGPVPLRPALPALPCTRPHRERRPQGPRRGPKTDPRPRVRASAPGAP